MLSSNVAWGWLVKGLGGIMNMLTRTLLDGIEPDEKYLLQLEYQVSRLTWIVNSARAVHDQPPIAIIRTPKEILQVANFELTEVADTVAPQLGYYADVQPSTTSLGSNAAKA